MREPGAPSAGVQQFRREAAEITTSVNAALERAPLFVPPHERFLELRAQPSRRRTMLLGLVGALCFFAVWELGHYLTPEAGRKFLPSVEQVIATLGREPSPDGLLVLRVSRRRATHVLGASEVGTIEISRGKKEVLGAGLGVDAYDRLGRLNEQ